MAAVNGPQATTQFADRVTRRPTGEVGEMFEIRETVKTSATNRE